MNRNLKLRQLLLIKFKRLSKFENAMTLRYMTFLAFVLDNSNCFYSCLEDHYEKSQSKYISMKFETSAR